MVKFDSLPLVIEGNPSDEEIAAISAACSLYLSSNQGRTGDNFGDNVAPSSLWSKSLKLRQTQTKVFAQPVGENFNWVSTHRIRARS